MTITFDGLDDAIADLKQEILDMDAEANALRQEMADIATNRMEEFKSPVGYYDSNPIDIYKRDENENTVSATVSGTKVMFIEYGAGNSAESPLGHGFDGPAYGPGSWSKDHAKEYTRFGKWTYKGVTLKSQPANRIALKAYEDIMRSITKTARRLFK